MTRNVAYQGAPGAFGEEACIAFLPDWLPVAKSTFAAVIRAVQTGEAERGILPLSNNTAGAVPGVETLIRESGLRLLSHHRLPVRMHLLGLPEAALGGIRIVASHPMALAQCGKWLDRAGLAVEEEANTAIAARGLAEAGRPEKAVIASEAAAKAYGLAILERDIHNSADNATIFGVVAREDTESK
jgi:prephenate dehydratase